MNSPQQRRLVSEVAVGLLVCGAAQFFFVGPAERELAGMRRAAEEQATVEAPTAPTLTAEALTAMARRAESTVRGVAERSEEARDETRLFTAIMSLAQRTGVRIDQLQPVHTETPRIAQAGGLPTASTPPAPDPSLPAPPKDASIGYAMVVTGRYEHLVHFVHHIPAELGFAVIRSLRISPDDEGDEGLVRAELQTEHFSFDVTAPGAEGSAGASASATAPGVNP